MNENKLPNAVFIAENYELESSMSTSNPPPIYEIHLLLYLLNDDVNSAKYLWKRAPKSSKKDELKAVWDIGRAMWTRDYTQIYKSFNAYKWSDQTTKYVTKLQDTFRTNTWKLISVAYSNLSSNKLANYVGLSKEETLNKTKELGWKVEGELVYPVPIETPKVQKVGIEQFSQLTEYVVWLERKN